MSKRNYGLLFVFFLAVVGFSCLFILWMSGGKAPWEGQRALQYARQQVDGQALLAYVERLDSPVMAGRRTGTEGEAKAGEYIAGELRRWGLEPAGEAGTYFQTYPLPAMGLSWVGPRLQFHGVEGSGGQGDNVLALLPGKDRKKTLIISAHYDHLGTFEGQILPGANDNASGVAVVMEMARLAKAKEGTPKMNLLFADFSGEEMGFLGSRYFVNNPPTSLGEIVGVINVDSVANGQPGQFIAWSQSSEDRVFQAMNGGAQQGGWNLKLEERGSHGSDHLPFAEKGIPGLTLLSASWLENNHTPKDMTAAINGQKLTEGAQLVWLTLEDLAY